jgi:hypothetical protein
MAKKNSNPKSTGYKVSKPPKGKPYVTSKAGSELQKTVK